MKKLPIFALIAALAATLLPACNDDNDQQELLDSYAQWREQNQEWLNVQIARTNPDGTPYFKTVVPQWNPDAFVLIHYFNDRALTEGNLSPLYTSTIDTRYHLEFCNGVAVDSSYLLTTWGPGIYRCRPCNLISGWAIAMEDMRVGDTAEVVVPYQQAYGISSSSSVPPYTNLKFNIALKDIVYYETNPN